MVLQLHQKFSLLFICVYRVRLFFPSLWEDMRKEILKGDKDDKDIEEARYDTVQAHRYWIRQVGHSFLMWSQLVLNKVQGAVKYKRKTEKGIERWER